ncbi:hypothetical protein KQX54_011869 [Cotesia glomerata]|uniref:Uncharacterized protein n=1 Tax=Cotesia glomerata TaxID=32391 RepID=A0AAV7IRZ2_COTGL|nr:hypothetical protein KQX54_011869 [Cotesia glomerata]
MVFGKKKTLNIAARPFTHGSSFELLIKTPSDGRLSSKPNISWSVLSDWIYRSGELSPSSSVRTVPCVGGVYVSSSRIQQPGRMKFSNPRQMFMGLRDIRWPPRHQLCLVNEASLIRIPDVDKYRPRELPEIAPRTPSNERGSPARCISI